MRKFFISHETKNILWCSLLFSLVARFFCNAVIPLTDTTEARYAEIARKMLETNNWITLQHDYGVPFWAKPPLSTWLSAACMKVFGINEFAARLPPTLLGIGAIVLIWLWCAPQRGRDFALISCAVLAGMSLFFMGNGAVMTDSSLVFCTTLTMISFWRALRVENGAGGNLWGYLFFVGLGVGLLAKGPVVGVMTFLPILPWIILHKSLRRVWSALPWIRGTILMLLISLPWYIIAEIKTPGFLSYFIFGEHFGRFLNSGWAGDRYGNAHAEPLGMIWVFWLIAALPWSFLFIGGLRKRLKDLLHRNRLQLFTSDEWFSYLLLWSFMPLVFFTFAHNIIWTYPLPTLPAFAVLVVESLARRKNRIALGPRLAALNFLTPSVLLIIAALYITGYHGFLKASQKESAEYYLQTRPSSDSGLYYLHRRYYSGEFYSAGKAKIVDMSNLAALLKNGHTDFLVIRKRDLNQIPSALERHFTSKSSFGDFVVLEEVDARVAAAQPSRGMAKPIARP